MGHNLDGFYFAHIGWVGVDLFFVLSGFLITGILLDSKNKQNYFKNFYIKRILRIFPLYYLFCFFLLVVYPICKFKFLHDYNSIANLKWYLLSYTENWIYSLWYLPKNVSILHLWSLCVEEQFYIFWPLVIFTINRKKLFFFCVLIILFAITLKNLYPLSQFAFYNTFTRIDGLAIGSIIAILFRSNLIQNKTFIKYFTNLLLLYIFCFTACVLLYPDIISANSNFNVRIGYTLYDLYFGAILFVSFTNNSIGNIIVKILSNRFLLFTGKISYGLYLYSWPIGILLGPVLLNFFTSNLGYSSFVSFLYSSSMFTIYYIVSIVSYTFFEKKILYYKKYFS